MVLVDTSVWVDHFNKSDPDLIRLLKGMKVCTHVFIIGELSCGNIRNRTEILSLMNSLPQVIPAFDDEVLTLIESKHLYGIGLGYIDVHLIASALINDVKIWTRDKSLKKTAVNLNIHK